MNKLVPAVLAGALSSPLRGCVEGVMTSLQKFNSNQLYAGVTHVFQCRIK